MRKLIDRPACAVPAILLLVGIATSGWAADDLSRWDGDARSAVRLLAGTRVAGSDQVRAGVEIRLKPGWHTYWRYPGDSGIPPRFDFAGSRNVRSVDVLWPAPQRLPQDGTTSIGYEVNVIFPLRVVAKDATRPMRLRVKVDYAICEKMCVPAEGRGEVPLSGGGASHDAGLLAAEARVPRKVALGEGRALAIRSVRREPGSGKDRVIVDVAGSADVALFAEGPTEQWALPVPEPIAGAPAGITRFAFELDGAPTGEGYRGAAITLTAVSAGHAIEVTTRLD